MAADGKEERAFEAIIVYCLRQSDLDDVDPECLPELSEEDRHAMDSLGSDFVQRILEKE